ncbi:MAG: galactose mutarotase [Spirochaetes bacterium]|nr:galactose mutarotase [Spirochaetota bacterium]
MKADRRVFGILNDKEVYKYTLSNSNGVSVSVINYGGIVTDLIVPGSRGKAVNIVLGYEDLKGYLENEGYLGALIGRFANRIKDAKFTLDGREYKLAKNENGKHHLHGGIKGFNSVIWEAEVWEKTDQAGVTLKYLSKDGEEGYPGNLTVTATYSLSEKNELAIEYRAETDKPSPVNLTNHSYWNLSGRNSGRIYNHLLKLNCPEYLPVGEDLIPTGEIKPVSGTPMDFREPKLIGDDIDKVPGGYDHCYILKPYTGKLTSIAEVFSSESGISMEVLTTMPGVQFYSGNFLHGTFKKHDALCLETQFYPDSLNRPEFPDCILRPGQTYNHVTVHRFMVNC